MVLQTPEQVTELLKRYGNGQQALQGEVFAVLYDQLRRLATGYMNRERANHTLQPTALVNEAYFKLMGQDKVKWKNRAHIMGVAAQAMRRILVDHARSKHAEKRGGSQFAVTLEDGLIGRAAADSELFLDLDKAMNELATINERHVKVVEMHFFGGMGQSEVAQALDLSLATVKRDLVFAKAWLQSRLKNDAD